MLSAVAPTTIHRQVVDRLGRLIVGGTLAPGDALPREDQLAGQRVVSRPALREATKRLVAKGLIESRQKTGARVRERRFWQQLDADVLGWRFAAMPADAFVVERVEMRDIIEQAAAGDREAWARAGAPFHGAVLNAANNALMSSLFNVVAKALHRFFLLSARASDDFRYALPRHFAVCDPIRRRSSPQARTAMQKRVDDSRCHLYPRGAAA